MTLLSFLATVFGVIIGFSSFPQVVKIFKRKNAKDLAITTYLILAVGCFVWVLYGFEIKNFPVILMNCISLVLFIFVIIGWFLYGRN